MSNDRDLRWAIEEELRWESSLDTAEIGVGVKNQVVSLVGHVNSCEQRFLAEEAASRVPGVRAVVNEIEVRTANPAERTDCELAHEVLRVLDWQCEGIERVQVHLSERWITLRGAANEEQIRTLAERVVAEISGVRGVTNEIAIAPSQTRDAVKEHIRRALQACPGLDARAVVVESDGTHVVLWGTAGSAEERDTIAQVAWSVPGVTTVANHITVGRSTTAMMS